LVRQAVACASADAVRELISSQAARPTAPLIEPELILMESDSATKAEAIKEAVDRLYVLGRTEEPREVEQAVWQREAVYSTGFGHGFAIPHCKTPAVNTNSIAVLKLRNPVAWGSLDHQPVRVMILLAIRESEQAGLHMQILSRLARKVMHDDFRDRLSHEQNPAALCAFLAESLSA
ncbi:MAG TPA: PTS sugar transporter subunit IIA, partial [Verrucomicrobiae bacterium]